MKLRAIFIHKCANDIHTTTVSRESDNESNAENDDDDDENDDDDKRMYRQEALKPYPCIDS